MGVLTDNRKRCLVDHRNHPLVASNPLTDLLSTDGSPPSKKPKLSSPPQSSAVDHRQTSDRRPPPPSYGLRCFPPASPLTRSVHGPQRVLKAFGLGASNSRPKFPPRDLELGNPRAKIPALIHFNHSENGEASNSLSRMEAKVPASDPFRHFENGETLVGSETDDGSESLGLEEYKRLVVDAQYVHLAASEHRPEEEPIQLELDLTIVANKDEDRSNLYVLNRNVEVSGKVVMEATPVREGMAARVKRSPLYKHLLEDSSRKRNPVLRNIEFEVKLAELRLSSLRQARKVQMKKPTKDLGEPFKPLTDEEEHAVHHALEGGSCRKVLVKHEASSIDITRDILQCLSSGVWLNDDVINLYLELLKEREKREPKRFLKCHLFNTFFYKKLISGKNGYDFKAVRRWTSQRKLGYSLIECDKIFVPVHKEVHWCLAVINVKDKKFQYLDSLGAMDRRVLRTLARYFMDEAKDKSNKQIDTTSWKQEAVDHLPLQNNGWDCGMFMLKYIDFYSRGLSLDFGQEHMEYFRRRTVKEILRLRAE